MTLKGVELKVNQKILNAIIRRAQYSTPTVAIANEIFEISEDFAVQLAMRKKTTCCEQFLENDKKMCLQSPGSTHRLFEVLDEFAPFFLQNSGKDDNERFLKLRDAAMKTLLFLSDTGLVAATFNLSPDDFYRI